MPFSCDRVGIFQQGDSAVQVKIVNRNDILTTKLPLSICDIHSALKASSILKQLHIATRHQYCDDYENARRLQYHGQAVLPLQIYLNFSEVQLDTAKRKHHDCCSMRVLLTPGIEGFLSQLQLHCNTLENVIPCFISVRLFLLLVSLVRLFTATN